MEYTRQFRLRREARGMTREHVAELAGCHPNTVNNIETGRPVKPSTLVDVLRAMGYPELFAATNRIEHYEIAGYGTARAFAECLGYTDDADILGTTLEEESDADEAFTRIATGGLFTRGLNQMAAAV